MGKILDRRADDRQNFGMRKIFSTLAAAVIFFLPSSVGAVPILDAHVWDDGGAHLMSHGADWHLWPDNPAIVQFQAINTGRLVSLDLRLAAGAAAGEKGVPQPVAVELWRGDQLIGTDAAGADVPYVWRGDLWNGQFPPRANFPQGYTEHPFVFPDVSLTAGETYEFRVSVEAGGTWLATDSLWGGTIGNVAYTVWVDPDWVSLLAGDVNADGAVDLTDFGILRQHMGQAGIRGDGDLTGDGRVDLEDFGELKDNFGRTAAAVPEPSGLALAAIALAALALLAPRSQSTPRCDSAP